MEEINNFSQIFSEENYIPIKTPLIQPMFLDLNSSSNSNVTYYNDVYGDSNSNQNSESNPIQNLLNNHNKEHQIEKNEMNNSILKEESTKIGTNDNDAQPKVVNIVSMVNLCVKLNLKHIALQCSNSEYNPSRINAVIMRIKNPKSAALIFNTGVIICLGAKNEEDSRKSAKIFAHNIKNLGYENVKFKNFKLINIVATCDLKFPIKLTKLSLKLGAMPNKIQSDKDKKTNKQSCFYNPEIFPGLIYHMRAPEITLLIFKSGKMNFVGAKKKEDIFNAYEKIHPLLCKYKIELEMNKNKVEEENVADFSNINNS